MCNFVGICSFITQQIDNFYNNSLNVNIIGASGQIFANQKLTLYPRITSNQQDFNLQNFKVSRYYCLFLCDD